MKKKYSNFGNVCNEVNNLKAARFNGISFLVADEPIKPKKQKMNCTNCEDTGYIFDTFIACTQCDLGKPVQHLYDKDELERLEKKCIELRKKIKKYYN